MATTDQANKALKPTFPDFIEDIRPAGENSTETVVTRYNRGKMLGKGGFAFCFVGTKLPSNRQYAIKIVLKSTLEKAKARQKLQSEIRIHRALQHKNIVQFDTYFQDNKHAYIILELCHHNSMAELMKRRQRLTDVEVRFYMLQLIDALNFLHRNLVIHRDLKLGNLFLDKDLNLKVGDFGLAARLTYAEEKRRTVCGTPNYIAPEILEGKEGHSFEVDVWSSGVIMYTLLIGTPPFQAADVKATYNRVLSNQYSFPSSIPICEHAENLIRHLLQHRSENRPKLDRVTQHSFFSRMSAYTPANLPQSCLKEPFVMAPIAKDTEFISAKRSNDENDAGVLNRQENKINLVSKPVPAMVKREAKPVEAVAPVPRRPLAPARSNSVTAGTTSNAAKIVSSSVAQPVSSTLSQRWQAADSENALAMADQATATATSAKMSTRSQSASITSTVAGTASTSRRFDIYNEKPAKAAEERGLLSEPLMPEKRPLGGYPSSFSSNMTVSQRKSLLERATTSQVDVIQQDLEGVKLNDQPNTRRPVSAKEVTSAAVLPMEKAFSTGTTSSSNLSQKKPMMAWASDETPSVSKPAVVKAVQVATIRSAETQQNVAMSPEAAQQQMHSKANVAGQQSGAYYTPPEQQIKRDEKAALNTLETMHEVLSSTYNGCCNDDSMLGDLQFNSNKGPSSNIESRRVYSSSGSSPRAIQAASVWVVGYVDYTSKYGFGFLLNTGSAGVYFNDNTKIILSSDGMIFQYIERRKPQPGEAVNSNQENVVQTHYINRYPIELQKKVTLMVHFKNYLVDQLAVKQNDNGDGNVCHLEATAKVSAPEIVTGATADIPFGISSVVYGSGSETELPYLKKWVRTKHALLFRLSNRTVQIVFFDKSEILLSSEARVVTYVTKQGERSEHSLEEVLQEGRKDIAKRLRYIKDVMYRLINMQK